MDYRKKVIRVKHISAGIQTEKLDKLDSTMKTILQGLITTSQCTKEKYYCTPMIIKTESA